MPSRQRPPGARANSTPPAAPVSTESSDAGAPEFLSRQVTAARRFYLDLRPAPRVPLSVVCGGWEECSPDYAIDRDSFPYFSVEFVTRGRGEVRLGKGRPRPLSAGTLFTYGPGVAQRIRTAEDEPLGKYFIDFAGSRARRLLDEAGLAPGSIVTLGPTGEVREAFELLLRLALDRDPHTERACALQLELLILLVRRAQRPASPAERRARDTFERARRLIDARFLALRGLDEIAAAAHVNASHLCRVFRRFQGEQPFRYLQRRRMQWAAARLDGDGRLVREVADELGLDPFHFSRVFKRVHGVPPSAFARRHSSAKPVSRSA